MRQEGESRKLISTSHVEEPKKGVAQLDDAQHGKEWLQRYPHQE